ncbi:MAG: WbuC family cupin fold metalloprotein [Verrucomicrobiae bacterium]|nr:WbuC family cupin fold metalloprotein [Verrucomicrobiae bacterium]
MNESGNREGVSNATRLALPSAEGPIFVLTDALMAQGCEAARHSPRRRIIFPIHRRPEARVQRMLNFMQPDTYVAPHRHPLDHAIETVQVLRGELGFLLFDESGEVVSSHRLSERESVALLDIEPNLWHGMVILAPNTVVLEIKRGPYDPTTDKEFAPWAPKEGDSGADAASAEWRKCFD